MEMMNICKLTFILTTFFVCTCFAEPSKVLIVNTNTAVPRYEKISTEFKNSLQKNAYQWQEFNVATHSSPDSDLEQLIQTEKPDIIYCIGSQAYSLSKTQATDKIIIFSAAINWQRLNIDNRSYGVANELSPEQDITLLRIFFPGTKKIGILYSKEFTKEYVETLKKVIAPFNIEIVDQQISHPSEISDKLNEVLPKTDLLWAIADPLIMENESAVKQLLDVAKQQQKPVYTYSDTFIKYGAALSITANLQTIGGQSANLLMSIKEGKIPADRVQFPAGTTVTLNNCILDSLKLPLRQEALSLIDSIIPCPPK